MFIYSIRWRLQLWLGLLLLFVLTGFGLTVYELQRVRQIREIDEQLEQRLTRLSDSVRSPPPPPDFGGGPPPFGGGPPPHEFSHEPLRFPPPPGPPPGPPHHMGPPPHPPPFGGPIGFGPPPPQLQLSAEVLSLFDQPGSDTFYFSSWSRYGEPLKASANVPINLGCPERPGRDTRTHHRTRGSLREAYHFTELGDCVLAGKNMADDLTAARSLSLLLLAAGGGVLCVGLAGGWWLTSRAIRPVSQISAAASRISAGNLSERIGETNRNNELGRLAEVLNATFARLEGAFAQQKQFTADASHELRTPLTVLITEAQTVLARKRSDAEYREALEACLAAAQQMRQLTESLLELARLDAGQAHSQQTTLDVSQQVHQCVEHLRPLADERGVRLQTDLAQTRIAGHAESIRRVIANLLSNAIYYNKPDGEIDILTRAENGSVRLVIRDTGYGIAEADLPFIFDRFYRADKSRSRPEGRYGLGLAICKAIVEAHRGTIAVASNLSVGTTFTVKFPAVNSE